MSDPSIDALTTISRRILAPELVDVYERSSPIFFRWSNDPAVKAEREATRAAFDARVAAGEVPVYLDQGSDYEDGPNGPAQWALATYPGQVEGWVSVEAWATYESELHRLEQLGDRLRGQLVT